MNFLRNLVLHLNCWIKSESYFRPQMRCLQNLSNVNSRLSPIVHPYNVPNVAELKRTFKSRVDELKVFLQVRSRLNQENGPVARGYKPQRPTRHSLSYQGNIFSSSWFNHFLVFIIRVSVFFFWVLALLLCVHVFFLKTIPFPHTAQVGEEVEQSVKSSQAALRRATLAAMQYNTQERHLRVPTQAYLAAVK